MLSYFADIVLLSPGHLHPRLTPTLPSVTFETLHSNGQCPIRGPTFCHIKCEICYSYYQMFNSYHLRHLGLWVCFCWILNIQLCPQMPFNLLAPSGALVFSLVYPELQNVKSFTRTNIVKPDFTPRKSDMFSTSNLQNRTYEVSSDE